ncbi:MAG: transposase [Acidobacteria bacterium]|nr:transposase [Acidobacteriota bacterium]
MLSGKAKKLTNEARVFLEPKNATHRQYEALRAYFVEGLSSDEAAKRFGYTPGSFRVLCHQFRHNLDREFFLSPETGQKKSPKKDALREQIIALRKQNLSVYDIAHLLAEEGKSLSIPSISTILQQEGFARLPQRKPDQRPTHPQPEAAAVADQRLFSLEPRQFRTKFGGIFLFLLYLAEIPFDKILKKAGFPGSKMLSAGAAMRSLLALKLFGNARHSHVMSYVFDEGPALFAGLNVIPKRSSLTEYSSRIDPRAYPKVMKLWFEHASQLGLERGVSFDLDFHTIPFHGEEALLQKQYISKRSRSQKGILAFLAWDGEKKHFCYANASLRKEEQADEVLQFIKFWKQNTGHYPEELVFDSKLTTYANLNLLNKKDVRFITLRRRSQKMLRDLFTLPTSAWRKIELDNVSREYRTPKIIDQKISLPDYEGPIRQIAITDLGHEEPTLLLTNQLSRSPRTLIGRYAQRMIIENGIADGIDFFHMDALSSAVALKVDCDLQLTLMASSLYRLLAAQIANGYETAKSRHIFRDFIDATAQINISRDEVLVKFQRRAHNPFLLKAGFGDREIRIPWWENKTLQFQFG